MEQTDGETAALTSPEDIKAQMKVAIADFQAGPHCVVLPPVLKKKVPINLQDADQEYYCDTEEHCHPKLPELCWVEAHWKDGQADKDFDEHTKVKKVFQDRTEVTILVKGVA